jgi:hypothetical protein
MSMTSREFWGVVHGLFLGTIYLLAFAGGFAGLWSLRRRLLTERGIAERLRGLSIGTWVMAVVVWLTTVVGTYIVYPWYRANLPGSARSVLLADPSTELWHSFGMEWKEHVAWLAPILATAVAYVVSRYGERMVEDNGLRRVVLAMFVLAFLAAAVAGLFGAFITKAAPVL